MQLYSVTIAGCHPMQCVTVTSCPERAEATCSKIKERFPHLRGVTYVEKVDSFFPAHMQDCDLAVSNFLLGKES